jgi:hypothetical protein
MGGLWVMIPKCENSKFDALSMAIFKCPLSEASYKYSDE